MGIDSLHHLFVAGTLGNFRFKIIAEDPFPAEEHIIEWTIEMILADISGEQRPRRSPDVVRTFA